jgi:predicted ribosomally synthesized peptide with nif11-like leader
MSIDAAVQFAEKAAADPALVAQIDKATAGKDDKGAAAAVVAIAKAQGFDFTSDEALALRSHAKREAGQELSDEELARVSGGTTHRLPDGTIITVSSTSKPLPSPGSSGAGTVRTPGGTTFTPVSGGGWGGNGWKKVFIWGGG